MFGNEDLGDVCSGFVQSCGSADPGEGGGVFMEEIGRGVCLV